MLLFIDNYDSFTYNIVQYLAQLGQDVVVRCNDEITLDEIAAMKPQYLFIGPGPCAPKDAGISVAAIRHFAGQIPICGICLGHQAIGEVFGGRVVRAGEIVHGKASPIRHSGTGLYRDIPNPTEVARYHSLIIARENLPDVLDVTSQLDDGTIMGVRHKTLPIEGIQFHPESILTPEGRRMMQNYLTDIGAI